jgi:hypothetical protein
VSFGGSENPLAPNYQIIGMATLAGGPGAYPLTLQNGANGLLTIGGTQLWTANAVTGGGGMITLTTLTATGVSGTFSFEMAPQAPATGTKSITNGVFNITF